MKLTGFWEDDSEFQSDTVKRAPLAQLPEALFYPDDLSWEQYMEQLSRRTTPSPDSINSYWIQRASFENYLFKTDTKLELLEMMMTSISESLDQMMKTITRLESMDKLLGSMNSTQLQINSTITTRWEKDAEPFTFWSWFPTAPWVWLAGEKKVIQRRNVNCGLDNTFWSVTRSGSQIVPFLTELLTG